MFAPLQSGQTRRSRNLRRGFTLIELLIVITVIAVLVGLLLPAVQAVRRGVSETTTATDIAQMDASLESFKRDLGFYPSDFSEFVDANGNALAFTDTLPNVAPFNGITVRNRLLQMLAKISPTHNELVMDDPNQPAKERLQIWWEDVGVNLAEDFPSTGTIKRDRLRGPQVALWFWLTQVFKDGQYPLTGPRQDTVAPNYYRIATSTEQRRFHDFSGSSVEVIATVAYPDNTADLTDPNEAHNVYTIARPVQRGGDAPIIYFHHNTYLDAYAGAANVETRIDFDQGMAVTGDPLNVGMACRVPGSSQLPADPPEFIEAGKYQILTAGYDEKFGDIEDDLIYENNDNICNFTEGRLDVFVDNFNAN